MKLKSKRRNSKKKNNTLSQRLSQCLSDSTESAKDFLLRSSSQNKDKPNQRKVPDAPIKKFTV